MAHITCTRRIEFDAAHRVREHESKCKHVHGHRYTIEATFAASERAVGGTTERAGTTLDALGRVIDFGEVRRLLGEWVEKHWDHNTILQDKDKTLGTAIAKETGQEIFYLGANPTAENMAEYLLKEVCPKLFSGSGARCTRLRLYETPNCYAEAE